MSLPIPERITYAQKKLLDLIKKRQLKQWCIENNLPHSTVHRIAIGESSPTYIQISSMCHLIAPIEWLFYTDEELPYKPETVPQWTRAVPCKYVTEHQSDFKDIAEKYGMSLTTAYATFSTKILNPTPIFIRAACAEVNPIEFFTASENLSPELNFIPEQGDIIQVEEKLLFVISKKEANEKSGFYTCCLIIPENKMGIKLENTNTTGFICPYNVCSFKIAPSLPRTLLEKAEAGFTARVIEEVKGRL